MELDLNKLTEKWHFCVWKSGTSEHWVQDNVRSVNGMASMLGEKKNPGVHYVLGTHAEGILCVRREKRRQSVWSNNDRMSTTVRTGWRVGNGYFIPSSSLRSFHSKGYAGRGDRRWRARAPAPAAPPGLLLASLADVSAAATHVRAVNF